VAYLASEAGIDLEQIRGHVRRHLPHYMEPAVFVVLGALPLTSSGKIDVRGLPEPPLENRSEQRGASVAATPSEQLIASVWSELLGVESVQPDSNFFELGGHSLVAAQMILRLRQLFRCELPLQLGFELRTLKELAAAVEAVSRQENATAMPLQQNCNSSAAGRGD
jgi:acyl carrier protein